MKSKDVIWILIILAIITSLNLSVGYGTHIFRDFEGVFEGAHRINLGQAPYRDFSMPSGPVLYYVQAFFNLFFGLSILSMSMHVIIMSAILVIMFYYVIKEEVPVFLRVVLCVGFYISYYGLLGFPWYNQAAFFFIFFNVFLLLLTKKNLVFVSSILAVFTFFAKQDIGAYHFIFMFAYYIFISKDKLKDALWFVIPFIVLVFSGQLLIGSFGGSGLPLSELVFSRMFKFFRPIYLNNVLLHPFIYLAIFFLYYLFKNKKMREESFLIVMLSAIPLFTTATSGLVHQTLITGFPLILFLIFKIFRKSYPKADLKITHIALFVLLLFAVFNYNYVKFDNESENVMGLYTRSIYQILRPDIAGPTLHYKINEGCFNGGLLHNNNDIERIRMLIENANGDFFSMTEYSFLYCDYGVEPPLNVPLWYHYPITFSDWGDVLAHVDSKKPKLILMPLSHNPGDINYGLLALLQDRGYKQVWQTSKINYSKSIIALESKD